MRPHARVRAVRRDPARTEVAVGGTGRGTVEVEVEVEAGVGGMETLWGFTVVEVVLVGRRRSGAEERGEAILSSTRTEGRALGVSRGRERGLARASRAEGERS